MSKKPPVLVVFILATVLIGAIYFFSQEDHMGTDKILVSGNIEATEIEVAAEAAGKLLSLEVNQGERVKLGDVLAKIDPALYDLQITQSEAALQSNLSKAAETKTGTRQELINQARANVDHIEALSKAARETSENARDNYNRVKILFSTGGVTEQQLNNAETQLQTTIAQYEAQKAQLASAKEQLALLIKGSTDNTINMANANVAQAQAALEIAKLQRIKTIITAPMDGVVSSVNIDRGELAAVGSNIVTLQDPSNLWVQVYIPETEIPKIRRGQSAKVFIDAYPEKAFPGEVVYISPRAEFTPKNLQTKKERVNTVFAVKIMLKKPTEQLKPGLPADVEINLK